MELIEKLNLINRELELEKDIIIKNREKQEEVNIQLEQENKMLRSELDKILYSRSYKAMQKIKKIIKRG